MTANGFDLGSQYSVPVGTTISFDDSKMTVTNAAGEVISEIQLNNNDKIDTAQPFAGQATTNQPARTNTSISNKPNASLPITKPSTPSKNPTADKEEAEKNKEQVEKENEEVEKELVALNESNNGTLLDLQVKRDDLQQEVEEARLNKKLSQEELAFVCNLHRTYISDIERAKRNVSIDNIEKIANALDIPPYELLIIDQKKG